MANIDAKSPHSNWGGKRNRADRVSLVLTHAIARTIISGAYQARALGLPLNRFITIHLERARICDADAAAAIGKIMKLATDWMRRKGKVIAYAWVRENDAGNGSKGSHVHILCHCPETIPIGRMWRRWLRNVTGRPYRAKTIKSKPVGATLGLYAKNPVEYSQNLDRVLAYICKGVTSKDAAMLGLRRYNEGGRIIGKRASVSENIGKNSRVLGPECYRG